MGLGGMGLGMTGGVTVNGLRRDRYLQTTETSRALPVAMVLIVDQANIPDVLVAVADSRMRIQTTQVTFAHVRGIQPYSYDPNQLTGMDRPPMFGPGGAPGGLPTGPAGALGGGSAPSRGEGGGGDMRLGGRGFGPPMPGGGRFQPPGSFPGMGPGSQGAFSMTGQEDDPNLVELAIYGIATLYEKYPPKKTEETTDASKAAETK